MKIQIVGLERAKVLLALYNYARCEGKEYDKHPIARIVDKMAGSTPGKLDKAKALMDKTFDTDQESYYFDYVDLGLGTRALKVNFEAFEVDVTTYDSYHGENQALRAIASVQNEAYEEALGSKEIADQILIMMNRKKEQEKSKASSNSKLEPVSTSNLDKFHENKL